MRHELRDAGSSRRLRLLARWHGLRALCGVTTSLLFTASPSDDSSLRSVPSRKDEVVLTLLMVVFYATFGPLAFASFLFAVPLAVCVHWWYSRHVARKWPPDAPELLRPPEINIASVPVGANAGGLFFVVGSIGIVLLGIPGLRTFFVAVVMAAVLLACALVFWRAGHPVSTLPRNTLVTR